MIKLAFGSLVAAVAMFITGFILYASPVGRLAYAAADDGQNGAVQAALAANLPATGTYLIPDPATPEGTTRFGSGPIATVHYNSSGYPLTDMSAVAQGFLQELLVCLLLAAALSTLDRRIPDFGSRWRIVLLFSLAASTLINLSDPIWNHHDWVHGSFRFVADTIMLVVAGTIIARWFLPVAADVGSTSPAEQGEVTGR